MSDFKGRHFRGEIVLWAVRWYCRYPISYRDLEAMMTERGVAVDHSTIYRWVQRFAPEMEKRLRRQWRRPQSRSWRVDETYIKVRGKWAYLYRAVDKLGNTIDFYLSATRNTKAAKRFLGKALRGLKEWEQPEVLNTDKAPAYAAAIAELKAEGKCPKDTRHRQVKYLNNVVEADHGKLKLLIRPVRGFKTMKTAYATIKGFEVMRALRKGQARGLRADRRDKLLKWLDTGGQNCTPNNTLTAATRLFGKFDDFPALKVAAFCTLPLLDRAWCRPKSP